MSKIKETIKLYIIFTVNFLFFIFLDSSLNSQYLTNGALTGPLDQDHIAPYGWNAQECDSNSTPNVYTSYFSNQTDSTIIPVDTPTFVVLRARGKYYADTFWYPPETREFLAQKLIKPLEVNSCFMLSVDLCTDLKMTVDDLQDSNKSYPVTLEIWGSNSICTKDTLLYVSKPISNTSWQDYHFNFSVTDTSYSVIRLAIQWDLVHIQSEPYNGILLLDHVRLIKIASMDTIKSAIITYKGDGKTTLTADSTGDSYEWNPNYNLSPQNTQSTTIQWYDPSNHIYTVIISKNSTTCPLLEIFNVKFNCDSISSQKIIDTVYYKYFEKVTLHANPGGVHYYWKPKTNLSDTTICCPYLTGFDTLYTVQILDRYGCGPFQVFKISANCDSLVPGKSALVLDTILDKDHPGILLKPKIGMVDNCSWTPLDGLSVSADCQSAWASPIVEKTYTVTVKDSFACTHNELFHIKYVFFVPNFITPNGDGHNDCFKIFGLPEKTNLKIFDKNGTLVFSASPYNDSNCWEGKDNSGKPLGSGTYWFVLNNPEQGLIKKGFVFLKR